MSDLANGPILIVGSNIQHHRNTSGTVALVCDLFYYLCPQLARAPFDGFINSIIRHVLRLRVGDGLSQAGIAIHIPTARARRHGDLLDELGEDLTALGVQST